MKNTHSRKRNSRPNVIDCGSPTDVRIAVMAMFRYAFGRRTYVPSAIIRIIEANAKSLDDGTLRLLDKELQEAAEDYERLYKDENVSNYGDPCDQAQWIAFHEWVKSEIVRRIECGK